MPQSTTTQPVVKDFKIVYIDSRNPLQMYSLMYDSENEALFGIQDVPDDMEFMIFKLKNYNQTGYHWEILPYGYYRKYQTAIWIYERKFVLLLFILILYLILKK
tara:strand:- start:1028 stop:1339 length:312 start_codon:yes stop_codon:yes gene_type:complete